MNKSQLIITVTIGKKTATLILVSVLLGVGIFWNLRSERAGAVTGETKLCVTRSGGVATRSGDCGVGERMIASGRYKTAELPKRPARKGKNVMPIPSSLTTKSLKDGTGVVLEASDMFESSLTSINVRYDMPGSWTGSISGSCPAHAPMFVSWGLYSPEFYAAASPDNPYRYMAAPLNWGVGMSRLYVHYSASDLRNAIAQFENGDEYATRDPRLPWTLYLTQVCAPIVQLQPIG
jgi:hypothetical protein